MYVIIMKLEVFYFMSKSSAAKKSIIVGGLIGTEFYFTEIPWPDFTKEELEKAIAQYNKRDRRYGGVKEEEDV